MSRFKASGARKPVLGAEDIRTDTLLSFVKWCQGRIDIQENLENLAACFGAEVVGISRWDPENGNLRLAGTTESPQSFIQPSFSPGFAHVACGAYIDSIKPGSALFLSEALDNKAVFDARLEQWLFKRNIKEIAVICLGAEGQSRDVIELHFTTVSQKTLEHINNALAPTFAEVFAGRKQGLMLEALLRNANKGPRLVSSGRSADILSLSNPANLTRAEWKICALIANGLSRDGIAKELSVKPCTIRTHLRNIYSKCGYDRFHELALHLVSGNERAHLVSHTQAAAA